MQTNKKGLQKWYKHEIADVKFHLAIKTKLRQHVVLLILQNAQNGLKTNETLPSSVILNNASETIQPQKYKIS